MKKVFALVLTIALIATLTVASFAAEYDNVTSTDTKTLTVIHNVGESSKPVYSVDVTWGDLELVYDAGTQTWNPDQQAFVADGNGGWDKDTLTIGVANRSNKVEGDASTVLTSAAVAKAATEANFTLKASGAPTNGVDEQKLATATIAFTKVAA